MKIYTSYYGNIRALKKVNIRPIGISRSTPKFFFDFMMQELAPRYDMLKMPEDQYKREFAKILDHLNMFEIIKRIRTISNGQDVALLCYEKPGQFCHRHLVADWITKQTGIEVTEYGYKPESLNPSAVQQSLF